MEIHILLHTFKIYKVIFQFLCILLKKNCCLFLLEIKHLYINLYNTVK